MKFYYKLTCVIVLCITGMSCKKFLDVVPNNVGTLDYAFSNRNEAENYLFGCYNTYQNLNREVENNVGFVTSSEIIYPLGLDDHPFNTIKSPGFKLIRGGIQNASDPVIDYWTGGNGGQAIYIALRRCNIMLENIDKPFDLKEPEKKRWIAEIKFLKAFYHYYLIRLYGPVSLAKENRAVDGSIEETKVKRATVDESFAYVNQLLDEAIPDLPAILTNRLLELGRPTKSISKALKAEVLTTAASPLFNGNPDYINFRDKDGVNLFSTAADPQKWTLAAKACKEAIDEFIAQGGDLYNRIPTDKVDDVSDKLKQVLKLQSVLTEKWDQNPELIISSQYDFAYQGFIIPKLNQEAVSLGNSYPSNWSVPISTTELFYTKNGVPINEDNSGVFDYANRNSPQPGDDGNKHYIKQGYETAKANFNREPRFYAALGFDGGIWFGNDKGNESEADYVQAKGAFALAGPKSIYATNVTGYWPKKLVHYRSIMNQRVSFANFKLPVMRLAGLYLLYAEALNEEGTASKSDILSWVDKVRTRAGLSGVATAWQTYSNKPGKPDSKEGRREIIRQERRIELCFEGQAGWDLRRWKELQAVLSRPLQGWSINEDASANYYRPRTVMVPTFGLKDYLWPIKNSEVVVNENLIQAIYWK
ncbi:MAG TPA: RagB/SusD family nutrient uptake outer membrane protein [Pedobacter sp.]|uniref:RagB/SusD family nutrient uptake outer membrane protein n=1 Tax=Pedobacter sp. TaxID=1411316 RepID=UPI002CDC0291|nr:RagB/SusD family nutrient uptake outer membrane protein [Pedobacter sp.]HMI03530.1 RagB/SusD family nutrient uptake outer membrane protein [Pedobacter sp.]